MNEEKPRFSDTLFIKSGKHYDIELHPQSTDGYYLIDIETTQQNQNTLDDIVIHIFDELNYNVFLANRSAVRAGATQSLLKAPMQFFLGKTYWGSIYFKPTQIQKHYLVLDNHHSTITSKNVKVKIHWKPDHSQFINSIKNGFKSNGWDDLWSMYQNAINTKSGGDPASTCDNLRKIIIILWTRVCEKLSGNKITIPEGKSVNTKPLEDMLTNNNTPNHIVTYITRTWSLVSELAHIEKNGGKQPSIQNTNLAINSSLALFGYLLSILEKPVREQMAN